METISLILTSVDANSNKYWEATLHDDGSIDAKYGRVGGGTQSTHYTANRGGKRFFDKKVGEKKKKGYVEQRTVKASGESGTTSVVNDVAAIAKSQIELGDPLLTKLVDRLVSANIHRITANSQITFDEGVFQTPLGVVTSDGIAEATNFLTEIYTAIDNEEVGTKDYYSLVGEYLTIVPQHVGKTVRGFIDSSFSTKEALKKQQDLLESLQASYDSLS
jgi:poly [ADP-ribose] polymerase